MKVRSALSHRRRGTRTPGSPPASSAPASDGPFPGAGHNVACEYLGLIPEKDRGDHEIDYQVFRALIGDWAVIDAIDSLADQLRHDADVRPDHGRLRLLDAALWTRGAQK